MTREKRRRAARATDANESLNLAPDGYGSPASAASANRGYPATRRRYCDPVPPAAADEPGRNYPARLPVSQCEHLRQVGLALRDAPPDQTWLDSMAATTDALGNALHVQLCTLGSDVDQGHIVAGGLGGVEPRHHGSARDGRLKADRPALCQCGMEQADRLPAGLIGSHVGLVRIDLASDAVSIDDQLGRIADDVTETALSGPVRPGLDDQFLHAGGGG